MPIKTTVLFATAAVAAAATVACAPPAPSGLTVVSHVVDGDTVEMSTGQTVRIIGVDSPRSASPATPRPRQLFGPWCRASRSR